jgi:hypothetical protein
VLALLVALSGGLAMAAVGGARRSASSLDRFRTEAHVLDLFVSGNLGDDGDPVADPNAFTALLSGPLVEEVADLVFVFADDAVGGVLFARTSERGADVERGVLIEGRYADPDEPLEVTLGKATSERLDKGVGDVLEVPTISQEQVVDLFETGQFGDPEGPVLELEVVGVMRNGFDIVRSDADDGGIILTPAFLEEYGDGSVGIGSRIHLIRLRDGLTGTERFVDEITKAYGDEHLPSINVGQREEAVRDAISVITTALALLGGLVAVAGIAWVVSSTARQQRTLATEVEVLSAFGATRAERRRVLVGAALPAVLAGSLLSTVVAAALSPLLPVGTARRLDPDTGVHIDALVLTAGAMVLLAVLLLALGVTATRLVGATATATRSDGAPVPRLADRVARILRPAPGTGVRFALHTPARGSAPVRSALAGACIGVIGLTAVAVVGANLQRLVDTPARWGTTWDVTIESVDPEAPDTGPIVTPEDRELLRDHHDVEAAAVVLFDEQVTIEGRRVLAATFEPVKGELSPTLVRGRAPSGPDEVAVGMDTLRLLHASVGSRVSIDSRAQVSADYRIVGVIAMPSVSNPGPLGVGAVFTETGGEAIQLGDQTRTLDDVGNRYMAVLWRDGIDPDDAFKGLGLPMARAIAPVAPPEMNGLSDVRSVPLVAAAALAILGVIATAHALVVTVRRRRRELGVLGSIGFAPGDRSAAIHAQATTIALVALAFGVPLGAAVGRLVWSTMADGLGVAGDAAFPCAVLAVGALGMAVVLNVIAVWPAVRARRLPIATALRSE